MQVQLSLTRISPPSSIHVMSPKSIIAWHLFDARLSQNRLRFPLTGVAIQDSFDVQVKDGSSCITVYLSVLITHAKLRQNNGDNDTFPRYWDVALTCKANEKQFTPRTKAPCAIVPLKPNELSRPTLERAAARGTSSAGIANNDDCAIEER